MKRILLEYTKALFKCHGINNLIAPNMKYLITYVDKYDKEAFYYGSDIRNIYRYLGIIGSNTNLTYFSQNYHYFGPKTNTDS